MDFSVPVGTSSPGCPGIVTTFGLEACLKWRWLPVVRTCFHPSASISFTRSRTFTAHCTGHGLGTRPESISPGHIPVQTTERCLGCTRRLASAVNESDRAPGSGSARVPGIPARACVYTTPLIASFCSTTCFACAANPPAQVGSRAARKLLDSAVAGLSLPRGSCNQPKGR